MYKTIIGLEIHCELKSNSKVFSKGQNYIECPPNSNTNVVDLGLPGILPTLNKQVVESALKLSQALNCQIPKYIVFDRKNYFYPDLPKGYQITQSHFPFGTNGYLIINIGEIDKKVLIHDIHLEEDTANLEHYDDCTLINYNRAGMPLIEIVTEPCLSSSNEVITFLDNLRRTIIYMDLSDARMDKGRMRVDLNISLMKETDTTFGTKVEIKNVSSFTNIKEAIEYEINRQANLLDNNEKIIQETRRFDEETKITKSMRSKVEAIDYKYFVEPNIPRIKIDETWLKEISKTIPVLPNDRVEKYINEYKLTRKEANIIVKDKEISNYFEELIINKVNPKTAYNWVTGQIVSYLNKNNLDPSSLYVTPFMLAKLLKYLEEQTISFTQTKEILIKALDNKKDPQEIIKEENLTQLNKDDEIRDIVKNILQNNLETIEKYKQGRNVFDYFVGQVMKETKGKANPALAVKIIKEEIINF